VTVEGHENTGGGVCVDSKNDGDMKDRYEIGTCTIGWVGLRAVGLGHLKVPATLIGRKHADTACRPGGVDGVWALLWPGAGAYVCFMRSAVAGDVMNTVGLPRGLHFWVAGDDFGDWDAFHAKIRLNHTRR